MKKILVLIPLIIYFQGSSQTPTGYWYGNANVKLNNSYNNYLVELIIEQQGNNVKGVLNYYFKNTYRSIPLRGSYNPHSRLIYFQNIPVSYYGSLYNQEVDCDMDFQALFRASKGGSVLNGSFKSKPQYKYTCPEISFNLKLNDENLNKDSVMNAIRNLKETYQVWRPGEDDTLIAARIQPRGVINYVVSNQFKERKNEVIRELVVEGDSIQVDFYDNGEIDGDSISVFLNNKLIASNQKLGIKSIHFDIPIDTLIDVYEISMFADNLGTIPPNTALMVVSDAKKRYEVRMSSNFEKNGMVRIRRKVVTGGMREK